MVKVVWDSNLPPLAYPLTTIQRWDEWFALVGLEKLWQAVKDNFENEQQRLRWATMIELNRISDEAKTPPLGG